MFSRDEISLKATYRKWSKWVDCAYKKRLGMCHTTHSCSPCLEVTPKNKICLCKGHCLLIGPNISQILCLTMMQESHRNDQAKVRKKKACGCPMQTCRNRISANLGRCFVILVSVHPWRDTNFTRSCEYPDHPYYSNNASSLRQWHADISLHSDDTIWHNPSPHLRKKQLFTYRQTDHRPVLGIAV